MTGNLVWERADTEDVWIGQSPSAGPTLTILGGVHGNEPTGIEVVESSRDRLAIDCGTVILALGNPLARGKKRYIDQNLNRSFRDLTEEEQAQDPETLPYEIRRAQALRPYLDASVATLDLHDFTNKSDPFIICERNALRTARAIGAPIISLGWAETEPGGTDGYMYAQGKEGVCYELGQMKYWQNNLARGHGAVARFLIAQGLIEGNLKPLDSDRPTRLIQTKTAVVRQGPFRWARVFSNFEALEADELIAVHKREEIRAKGGDVIIFPMRNVKINEEAFTLGYDVAQ